MKVSRAILPLLVTLLVASTSYAASSEVADAAMKGDTAAVRALLVKK